MCDQKLKQFKYLDCVFTYVPKFIENDAGFHDSSNGGVTNYIQIFKLVSEDTACDGGEFPENTLVLMENPLRAVPFSIYKSGARPMRGGNFIHTADSRFPAPAPIPVYDRLEGSERMRVVQTVGDHFHTQVAANVTLDHWNRDRYLTALAKYAGFRKGYFRAELLTETEFGYAVAESRELIL